MTKQPFQATDRAKKVNPFRVMDVLERAMQLEAQGRDIIHLEVGEPDFTTSDPIVAAGVQALQTGRTSYTPASGLPVLRERIARFYAEHHEVDVEPSRIIITPGASGALVLLSNLLINPGDHVLMPDPAYPCNRNYVQLVGGQSVLLAPETPGQAAPSIEQLDSIYTDRVKGLWLASPANPTGAVIESAALQELSDWAQRRNVHLLVDEIYHGLDFTCAREKSRPMGDLPSAVAFGEQNFVINSFSKYFGMTGWRVGWLVVPQSFAATANVLAQNLFIAACTASQHAALAAFDPASVDIHEARREAFRQRRDFLASALPELGFSLPWQPQGAFYCYAGIDRFSDDCEAFCQNLLENHGVALTPGTDFGEHSARRYVRFAYTRSLNDMERAVERLAKALRSG
ncbi:MAG TPA: aminotransferase [Pseudohongiella sp.]|nr:aminotransferase [Pseudohongiella sp.]HBX38184.1 aminotransferase [Pseudohongiella sp.]|tara:strand:+ start:61 stop:1263 length:1203 start_codon:yes stop_codon:yes gene_type:complete